MSTEKKSRKESEKENTFEIISKVEKFWINVKERTEQSLFNMEQEMKLNHKVLEFAIEEVLKEEAEAKL